MRRGEYALGDEIIVVQAYQTVDGGVHLGLEVATLALREADGVVDEVLVGGLVCRRKDERRVGGRILGLVDIDGWISPTIKEKEVLVKTDRQLCVCIATTHTRSHRSPRQQQCPSASTDPVRSTFFQF